MKNLISIITAVILFTSCKSTKDSSYQDVKDAFQGSFTIEKMNGKDINDMGLTFIVDLSKNKVSGNSGCNTYSTSFELSETKIISFGIAMTTKVYCTDNDKNLIEKEYLKTLTNEFKMSLQKGYIDLVSTTDPKINFSLQRQENQ